ncbi:MAG: helix-turn-helix domain-containing protein [Microbacteriaceae bacterium]|nr:helix-turn-helix domain-containing protein [Microbacteriaceae bacterium]
MQSASTHSQTLSRGLQVLELLADSTTPPSIADLASALGVHRSIAYRILRTLEDHGLVLRNAEGGVQLAPRVASLARNVARDLQSAALPSLTAVANDLGMTAFLAVLDRAQVVTLVSVEPSHAHASIAQRPGTSHSISSGAPGIAIQSILSPFQLQSLGQPYRTEALEVGLRGFATSHDEVISGLSSVAVPLKLRNQPPATIAVVYVASISPVEELGARLSRAAEEIKREVQ